MKTAPTIPGRGRKSGVTSRTRSFLTRHRIELVLPIGVIERDGPLKTDWPLRGATTDAVAVWSCASATAAGSAFRRPHRLLKSIHTLPDDTNELGAEFSV